VALLALAVALTLSGLAAAALPPGWTPGEKPSAPGTLVHADKLSTLARGGSEERQAQEPQVCVDHWNNTNMKWNWAQRAIVQARPCRVTIAAQHYRGAVPRSRGFRCQLNTHGAYGCPSHYNVAGPGPLGGEQAIKGWNARLRSSGRLILDDPPRDARPTPPPNWASRYPVVGGLIVPFTAAGQLRPGLRLRGPLRYDVCSRGRMWTSNGPLRCGETLAAEIRCFPPRQRVQVGDQLACPMEEGSRVFTRLVLTRWE
jgi:hypothetical protein